MVNQPHQAIPRRIDLSQTSRFMIMSELNTSSLLNIWVLNMPRLCWDGVWVQARRIRYLYFELFARCLVEHAKKLKVGNAISVLYGLRSSILRFSQNILTQPGLPRGCKDSTSRSQTRFVIWIHCSHRAFLEQGQTAEVSKLDCRRERGGIEGICKGVCWLGFQSSFLPRKVI